MGLSGHLRQLHSPSLFTFSTCGKEVESRCQPEQGYRLRLTMAVFWPGAGALVEHRTPCARCDWPKPMCGCPLGVRSPNRGRGLKRNALRFDDSM